MTLTTGRLVITMTEANVDMYAFLTLTILNGMGSWFTETL